MRKIGIFLFVLLAVQVALQPSLRAAEHVAVGKKYTAPHHVFTVILPAPTADFDNTPYSVAIDAKKNDHEVATFYLWDFGVMYRAGVLLKPGQMDLATVANKYSVSARHQLANPPQCIEETKVNTQFGEGTLRLYFAKKGSLVEEGWPGHQKVLDSYIAVLVVRQGPSILLAAAQNDNVLDHYPEDKWKQQLKDSVQEFFATLKTKQ